MTLGRSSVAIPEADICAAFLDLDTTLEQAADRLGCTVQNITQRARRLGLPKRHDMRLAREATPLMVIDPEGRAGTIVGPTGQPWLDTAVDFGRGPEWCSAACLRPLTPDADRRPGDRLGLYAAESARRGWPR